MTPPPSPTPPKQIKQEIVIKQSAKQNKRYSEGTRYVHTVLLYSRMYCMYATTNHSIPDMIRHWAC